MDTQLYRFYNFWCGHFKHTYIVSHYCTKYVRVCVWVNSLSRIKFNDKLPTFNLLLSLNPRGDHWAEFGPRDQCRLCARPKFGPIWYDVVEQFSFPSLVTDPGKKGVIGKLIHSSSCANFIQVQNAVSPNDKTRGKVVPIFG